MYISIIFTFNKHVEILIDNIETGKGSPWFIVILNNKVKRDILQLFFDEAHTKLIFSIEITT